ncbi:hypothetical protein JHD50_02265 [Sulfurimonas sp. MAG313]|nr:hypothetical protein [Sulfurimonas sp. MAG313]MDF1880136.1 hypothetical protein [Sulfurimonas sp. MAG313]
MADESKKLYMEIQMEELKASLLDNDEDEDDLDPLEQMMKEQAASKKKKVNVNSEKEKELAKMYIDAYEYEQELELFEKEMAIVRANDLKDIASALRQEFPEVRRDYEAEFKQTLVTAWTHNVEVKQLRPQEQLDLIKKTEFIEIVKAFESAFPDYEANFESEVKLILVKKWEVLIGIKKNEIEEELEEIYIAGLKPSYVKRIYKQVNGLWK